MKLEYNFLNLTGVVRTPGGAVQAQYRWLADGAKVGVKDGAGSTGSEYLGSLIYQRVGGALVLESTGFGGGRINVASGGSSVDYYITDHLGSTRVIFNNLTSVYRSDFTAFGTRWTNGAAARSRYQFAGYEDQTLLANKYSDAGARLMSKVLPVFLSPDQLSEVNPKFNPFHYASNNPVNRTDPTGMLDDWYLNLKEGQLEQFKGVNDDLWNIGYQRVAEDNASIEELGDALTELGYDYVFGRREGEAFNSFQVDSGSAYKGWAMMQVFSPDNVGTVMTLGMGTGGVATRKAASQGAARATANYVEKAETEQVVYRVFGGDSKAMGRSWTPVHPGSVPNYRNAAGLPSGGASGFNNTGRFVIEGTVKNKYIMQTRPAEALDGFLGGLPEYLIDPAKVTIKRVSGVNPNF